MESLKETRTALVLLLAFTVLTGILYPFIVTAVGTLLFPENVHGSLILGRDGRIAGSTLIGQPFSSPGYFWGRPSATQPFPYNAAASSGSNYGPMNPALRDGARARILQLHTADSSNIRPVPVDLVTASGSGLDPHISIAAARYQEHRVAAARHLSQATVRGLIDSHSEWRSVGLLGEPRINVLVLNLALDSLSAQTGGTRQ